MGTPFFSIVIPTHNRPHLLDRALLSIFAQDFKDYEIIIVNDGSHLSYDEVFRKYGAQIQKIIVHDVARGVSAARNAGIAAARGQWISFLDDDDEYVDGFLHRMHRCVQASRDDAGFAWTSVVFQKYDKDGKQSARSYRNYRAEYASEKRLFGRAITIGAGFGLTVKRECLEKAGSFDLSFHLGEDTEFILRLLANGYKPVICPELGVIVHLHNVARPHHGVSERVRTKVYERLAEKYLDFIRHYPEILSNISGRSAWLSYSCGDFSSGDRLLFQMLRAAPVHPFIWLCFFIIIVGRSFYMLVPAARIRGAHA